MVKKVNFVPRGHLISDQNTQCSQWVTITEKTNLAAHFTAALELSKPVKRFWPSDGTENVSISKYREIESRATLIVSTKSKFTYRNSEAVEANMGRIRCDKKLIENYIENRKQLKRELLLTPAALRHGQAVSLKPKLKSFQKRIQYLENKKKAEKQQWVGGEVKTVDQEKNEIAKGIDQNEI